MTGALSGLTRVRQFQQDDCHVFLREDQIAEEVNFLLRFILEYYKTFGLTATLSSRPGRRSASATTRCGIAPKRGCAARSRRPACRTSSSPATARFTVRRSTSTSPTRSAAPWQLGTIQLDYNAPERFDLTYVGEDNTEHRPVVIHRAVSGSFERFIAILIEHFAGAFPLWLAPEQVRVLPITDDYNAYAEQVTKRLHDAGVRVHLDARSETLKYRVAEGARMKVPYMVVVGRRVKPTRAPLLSTFRRRGQGTEAQLSAARRICFQNRQGDGNAVADARCARRVGTHPAAARYRRFVAGR